MGDTNNLKLRKRKPSLSLSLDSVCEKEKEKLLDFNDVQQAVNLDITISTSHDLANGRYVLATINDSNENATTTKKKKAKKKKDSFDPSPKMNTFVGFLRLANYVCATTVIFGLSVSLFFPRHPDEPTPVGFRFWQEVVYFATGWIQCLYLASVALLVMVDAIATFTFRWKEYGELTHTQTDAASIIFFVSRSRWAFRLAAGLILATATSLRTTRIIKYEQFSPHDHLWYFGLSLTGVASAAIGFLLNLFPWHRVHWLRDSFHMRHIEDKGDVWTWTWNDDDDADEDNDDDDDPLASQQQQQQGQQGRGATTLGLGWSCANLRFIVVILSKFVFLLAYVSAFVIHCLAFSISLVSERGIEFWMLLASFVCCQLLNLGALLYVVLEVFARCKLGSRVPTIVKLVAPFVFSSAVRSLIEVRTTTATTTVEVREDGDSSTAAPGEALKIAVSYYWLYLMVFMTIFFLAELSLRLVPMDRFCTNFGNFLCKNIREDGVNKKTIRFFDTLGSLTALVALVLGLCSLFIDQYDLVFMPDGFAKDVADTLEAFQVAVKPVTTTLSKIIDALDRKFTCDDVYSALGTGTAITLFASFFPGAGSVASVGSRSAYYGVRAANALTNLANKLRRSKNAIWQLTRAIYILQKFTVGNLKELIVASNFATLVKLLPFFPPVVLGIYVLFGAFWPQRILFFSAKQRRKTVAGLLYSRLLGLLVLSVAIAINTALVDEIVRLLDENIPLVRVSVERKLGWHLSAVAFGFSFASLTSYAVAAIILKLQTFKDHQNLTNDEREWKQELEKRELLVITTGIGAKIEKRTQVRYKKERIGPWTWVLPILLCLIACGFGYLANISPKLEFQLEPRGSFGRVIDSVDRRFGKYEDDMYEVKNDTEMECLPYTSFHDMWSEKKYSNVLMNPVTRFFNETEKLIKPVRDVLTGLRKQLLLDVQDELFGDTLNNIWKENNLQYIGMLLMVPRVICLLILLFGMATASIWVCQMRIIQSVEPKNVVNAYGKVALFSVVYVVGSQLAIFNLISTFGIPFYHISIRFGLGFIYDLVADFILMSVYIGMNNDFFFAIPKRKVMVTYSVPGASDLAPNNPGQVI